MKKEIIGLCLGLLLFIPVIPAIASSTQTTPPIPQTFETTQAFIFGRYTNLTAQGEYLTIETVNMRALYKDPRSFKHFPAGTILTFEMYTAYGHIYKKVEFLFLHVQLIA
jgi:hypothetical protein